MTILCENVFFPSKVPGFLHVVFNVIEKHGPVYFFAEVCLVFEMLHMVQKTEFVIVSVCDCKDVDFT